MGVIVDNLLRDRHQPLITRLSGVTASPPYCHSARASPDSLRGVTVVMTSLSFGKTRPATRGFKFGTAPWLHGEGELGGAGKDRVMPASSVEQRLIHHLAASPRNIG
jgi:hypothetical protein